MDKHEEPIVRLNRPDLPWKLEPQQPFEAIDSLQESTPRRIFGRRRILVAFGIFAICACAVYVRWDYFAGRWKEINKSYLQISSKLVAKTDAMPAIAPIVVEVGMIDPARIEVIDGRTIRLDGKLYLLTGFETAERQSLAKCESEHNTAVLAIRRLRAIVASGGLKFEKTKCACPSGTEGTQRCNQGRLCGVLTASGRDVGSILIGEGLAESYICGATKCPPKKSWC